MGALKLNNPSSIEVEPPGALELRHIRFTRMATLGCLIGHFAFSLLFFALGLNVLGVANIGSALLFTGAYLLVRRGRIVWAIAISWFEITMHAVLTGLWIGWATGFHLYLLLLAPIAFSNGAAPLWRKAAFALSLGTLYVALDMVLGPAQPYVVLSPTLVDLLRHINIAGIIISLAYEMHWYAYTAMSSEKRLHTLATVDPLTGLANRRHLDDLAARALLQARQTAEPFSVILIDVDHFKAVNDQHGHAVGDEVLKALANALISQTRDADEAARWGGEEFLVLLPATSAETALSIARRLVDAVRQMRIEPLGQCVTCTLGIATWTAGESFHDCVQRADEALYRGKSSGRDRIEFAHAVSTPAGRAATANAPLTTSSQWL